MGLDVGGGHRLGGPGHRRLEAEGAVDEAQVVVYGLGNAHDGERYRAAPRLVCEISRAPQGPVAADTQKDVDPAGDEKVEHDARVLRAARSPQYGSAGFLDAVHDFQR